MLRCICVPHTLNYLIPVVAILLGWIFLGEAPPWTAVGGGALCVAGVHLARRGSVVSRGIRSDSKRDSL